MPLGFPDASFTATDDTVSGVFSYVILLPPLVKLNTDFTRSWFASSDLSAITSCSTIVLPLLSQRRKHKVLFIVCI